MTRAATGTGRFIAVVFDVLNLADPLVIRPITAYDVLEPTERSHEADNEAKAHRRAAGRGRSRPPPARAEPSPPTAGRCHQSAEFHGDFESGGEVQSRTGRPGNDAGRGSRADGDRPAGSVPIRNG